MKSKNSAINNPERLVKSDNLFPVVGIGASAGGLTAFKKLLKAIPEDSGMAYVLVQHLDPNHDSLLSKILQKVTKIPVLEISDDCKTEPDHIYVMPSNKIMVATDGILKLEPRPKRTETPHLPINIFFESLAEVHDSHAIGVLLSGTGSDGTKGLKSIKDNGGITLAQDEESAEYEGMPDSAKESGVVDFILPPDRIPEKLLELTNIISTPDALHKAPPLGNDDDVFRQIISLLQVRKGVDFTYYKQTTIRRRILRRTALNKKTNVGDYLTYLRKNREEQNTLYQDFLIPVTSFFRDPEIFKNVRETCLPIIKKNRTDGEPLRVWVAGCSTGEEAYSLAILFKEFFTAHSLKNSEEKIQIFASDLSEPAIQKARLGIYSEIETAGVSEKRRNEFFVKLNGKYQVTRQIRDMCVFANHNFLKDPPFGKMDLISCRNVLIYMEPYLQKKALTTFHYALNSTGFLLLGKSETTGGVPDLFSVATKSDKIYSRKNVPSKFMAVVSRRTELDFNLKDDNPKTEKKSPDFQKKADEIMLSKYTPAGVVVNEAMDIVQFRGKTSDYLEQTSGKPSHNLFILAKQGMAFELRALLNKAKKEKAAVKKEMISVKTNKGLSTISIEAIPLPNTIEPYFLVLFQNSSARTAPPSEADKEASKKSSEDEKDLRIRQLEQELMEMRENMRSITEDQEAANEELQSANEELMSGSEELQSLNEELETSKEELQSTNEELIVVNHEMINLNEQLAAERNYSQSIVANIREPLLVLDKNLCIRLANNAFYKLFKMNEKETEGTLIFNLGDKHWNIPELRKLFKEIIPQKSMIHDFEVTHTFPNIGELIMLLNAREVKSEKNQEKMILLSIEDITKRVNERKKIHDIREQHTKELLQNNKDLVKMNKELEAFAYVSSHDLQEPLRKIQTFAGRILEKESGNLSNKGKKYFTIMQDSANRMQGLIEDLLNFSRLTTAEREFETVNLKKIIEEVKDTFKESINEKDARIDISKNCEIYVIVFQFRQLLHNLISNALKYSKPGKPPKIVIHCNIKKGSQLTPKNLSPQKKYYHITVTDNGIGFEEEFSEKIFEVFQKLHPKEEYPGTGIGLATVKKIVNNHHGIIKAKSELNKGTTFEIYIPAQN
ncbi:MAG: chemotaxis protein CheB [Balneolaceae bacterium]